MVVYDYLAYTPYFIFTAETQRLANEFSPLFFTAEKQGRIVNFF
jgi:hypothetical protein